MAFSAQVECLCKVLSPSPLFFFFAFFRAVCAAYVSSQARSQVRAAAASLHHSHRNTRSELHLWPTSHLMAINPWARPGLKPTSSWILVRFITTEPQGNSLSYPFFNGYNELLVRTIYKPQFIHLHYHQTELLLRCPVCRAACLLSFSNVSISFIFSLNVLRTFSLYSLLSPYLRQDYLHSNFYIYLIKYAFLWLFNIISYTYVRLPKASHLFRVAWYSMKHHSFIQYIFIISHFFS